MSLMNSLIGRGHSQSARRRARTFRPGLQPALEGLESRVVLSHATAAAAIPVPADVSTLAQNTLGLNLTGITFDSLSTNDAGQIIANGTVTGTLAGHDFSTPAVLTVLDSGSATTCPILDLHINAIDLNLLGLEVKTSDICLNISATPGDGNLLGNLLCGLTGLLDPSAPALTSAAAPSLDTDAILGQLNDLFSSTTSDLLGQLNSLLGSALTPTAADSSTDVLNLSLAPVDLNLLGLNVHLDNCDDGPVTVDIIAHQGSGKLLGNLIGGIAHLLDSPGNPLGGVLAHVNKVLSIAENAPLDLSNA